MIIGFIRATIRFLFLIIASTVTVSTMLLLSPFVKDKLAMGMHERQKWCIVMMRFLGVKIIKKGNPNYQNILYLSNHRSYIDPLAKFNHFNAFVLAKSEVRSWPLIGYGCSISGVHFVKREEKTSRANARETIADVIKSGHSILIYPEGTTTDLPQTLPFKPSVFQMAAAHEVKIIPIAIEYKDPKDAWIGDDTFVRHFFQTFAKRELVCAIHYGPPMWDADAEILSKKVQNWVDTELLEMRKKWDLPLV